MYGDWSGEFVCGYWGSKGLSVWKKTNNEYKKIKPLEGIMIYLSLEAALPLLQGCDQSWQLYCTLKNTVVFVKKELQTFICS